MTYLTNRLLTLLRQPLTDWIPRVPNQQSSKCKKHC